MLRVVICTLLAGGHLLLEDRPGVGKTQLARSLADSIDGRFARVQGTVDLLPTDVLGTTIWRSSSETFEFHPGPIFANVVLVDELNRATPKTQSGLLEAMAEGQVTVEGRAHHAAPALHRDRDPEPDRRLRRHLRAATRPARPLHDPDVTRLPERRLRGRPARLAARAGAAAGRPARGSLRGDRRGRRGGGEPAAARVRRRPARGDPPPPAERGGREPPRRPHAARRRPRPRGARRAATSSSPTMSRRSPGRSSPTASRPSAAPPPRPNRRSSRTPWRKSRPDEAGDRDLVSRVRAAPRRRIARLRRPLRLRPRHPRRRSRAASWRRSSAAAACGSRGQSTRRRSSRASRSPCASASPGCAGCRSTPRCCGDEGRWQRLDGTSSRRSRSNGPAPTSSAPPRCGSATT